MWFRVWRRVWRGETLLALVVLAFMLWVIFGPIGGESGLPYDPGDCDPHERPC